MFTQRKRRQRRTPNEQCSHLEMVLDIFRELNRFRPGTFSISLEKGENTQHGQKLFEA